MRIRDDFARHGFGLETRRGEREEFGAEADAGHAAMTRSRMPSGILVRSCSLGSATGRRSAGRTTQGVLTRFGGRNYQRPVLRGPPKRPDRAPPPDPGAFATFTISFRVSNALS